MADTMNHSEPSLLLCSLAPGSLPTRGSRQPQSTYLMRHTVRLGHPQPPLCTTEPTPREVASSPELLRTFKLPLPIPRLVPPRPPKQCLRQNRAWDARGRGDKIKFQTGNKSVARKPRLPRFVLVDCNGILIRVMKIQECFI